MSANAVQSARVKCVGPLVALLGATSIARAEDQQAPIQLDKTECVQHAETAQRLRLATKLVEARSEALACVRSSCPPLVRTDCESWLAGISGSIPTIIFHVTDANGASLENVSVTVDAKPLVEHVNEHPIDVDPGEHTFVFTHDGSVAKQTARLEMGDKGRILTIRLAEPAPDTTAPRGAPAGDHVAPPPKSSGASTTNYGAWVATGVAALALGSFVYFGVSGKSELDATKQACGSACTQSDIQPAWNRLIVADVSLAVSALATGAALWLFLDPPGAGAATRPGESALGVAPGAHTLALSWKGSF